MLRTARAVAVGVMLVARVPEVRAQRVANDVDSVRVTTVRPLACDTAWTSPRELRTPLGQRVYVEAPAAISDARGRYLLGTPTFVWATRDSFATPERSAPTKAAGARLVGEWSAVALPPLPGSVPQYTPVPVIGGGNLLALWATSRDTTSSGFFGQDTLWESRLLSHRWSAPKAIWSAGELSWHPGTVTVTTAGSKPLVAFPARDTTRSPRNGVVVLERSRDDWRTTWIGTGHLGASAAVLLPLSASELLIVATGPLNRPPIDAPNAIYAIRVSTAGAGDGPRFSLIREWKQSHAVEPSVFRSREGVHVVWRQPGQRRFVHDSLVEATSTDMGATWTATSAASLETNAIGMSVRLFDDGDGVGAALDARGGRIITLRRASRQWRLTSETFPDARTMPMLSQTRERVAVMFAQTRRSPGPQGSYDAPVLVTTSRALRCEPSPANRSRKRLRAPPRG